MDEASNSGAARKEIDKAVEKYDPRQSSGR